MARKLFFAKVNDTPRMRHYRVSGLIGGTVVVYKNLSTDTVVFLERRRITEYGFLEHCGGIVGLDYTLLHD
tara:strand:- start:35603 stop:35815 length:213 start_codon:yes stop_codon:yes gene_type:complete